MSGLNFVITILLAGVTLAMAEETPFNVSYHLGWGHATLINESEVQLLLDKQSGGGFKSNLDYLSGLFQMKIKLSKNKSEGVISSFFLSEGDFKVPHNEFDYEFLVQNNTYKLQTNIFNNDMGHREQVLQLWFDPTTDFHDYHILWNQYLIVFFVDFAPIRVFKNLSKSGLTYPTKPMHIEASIWTGSWAGKIDYSLGPFAANYRYFSVEACSQDKGPEKCNSPDLPWNQIQALNQTQQDAYNDIRNKYLLFDYCKNNSARECKLS